MMKRLRVLPIGLTLLALCCLVVVGTSTASTAVAQEAKAPEKAAEPTPAPEKAPETPATTPPVETATEASKLEAVEKQQAVINVAIDTTWVLLTGFMVFFMNLGFACVESGMCRQKNAVNILSKNFIVFAVSSVAFWLLGWGLMFGSGPEGSSLAKYIGMQGLFCVTGEDNSPATLAAYKGDYGAINWTGIPLNAKFFFQLVFCGTAATIVSGAVAERIKYLSFIVFSFAMGILIYPVVGHWVWGGGWLQAMGFVDFAGSTQVHSVGGWAALIGVMFLGPRIGKYTADGKVNAIPGHSMMAATIGCLILWFGWFGFNPGSTMGISSEVAYLAIADIAVTTNTAAAFATVTATATCWLMLGKPDIGMTLNGCLAGLVAITAPCAFVSVPESALIGSIAGVIVVLAVVGFDKLKIDDPVGATSVHLINGVFGTICVGLFSDGKLIVDRTGNTAAKAGLFDGGGTAQLMTQLTGVVACAVYVCIMAAIVWAVLKFTIGIRVSEEEEIGGLDHGEHGNEAYHGFQMTTASST
jgi:Amt family ammonium transporter